MSFLKKKISSSMSKLLVLSLLTIAFMSYKINYLYERLAYREVCADDVIVQTPVVIKM